MSRKGRKSSISRVTNGTSVSTLPGRQVFRAWPSSQHFHVRPDQHVRLQAGSFTSERFESAGLSGFRKRPAAPGTGLSSAANKLIYMNFLKPQASQHAWQVCYVRKLIKGGEI